MPGQFFYGWVVVAVSLVIFTVTYGLQFSFGVFLPHIMQDLELDRAAVSAPFSLYIFFYAFFSLVTGPATDRFGPRSVVLTGGILLALGYSLLSSVASGWQIFVYFSVIAGAGMSASYVPLNATVVRWFDRYRGLALAITGTGLNTAMVVGPMLAALFIPWLGWRTAMLLLGLGGGCVIVCCALALARDPASRNLRPDGRMADRQSSVSTDAPPAEVSWTLAEARGGMAFWLILGVFFLTWTMVFFPNVHLPALAADLGHDPTHAAGLVAVMGLGGLAGRVAIGWSSDLIGRMAGLHLAFVVQIAACAIFASSGSLAVLYLAAGLYGAGVSAAITLFPAVIADAFGSSHVGAIAGFIFGIAGTAAAIGPYAGGFVRDMTGSYQTAFVIAAVLNVAAMGLLAMLRLPRKSPGPASRSV